MNLPKPILKYVQLPLAPSGSFESLENIPEVIYETFSNFEKNHGKSWFYLIFYLGFPLRA